MIVGQTSDVIKLGVETKTADNFCGYFHESEFETVGNRLNKDAENRAFAGGY